MRISAKTDYAVRAAAVLAASALEAEPGTTGASGPAAGPAWVKTDMVAEAQKIPLPFLLNILGELRTAGLVQSRRGVDGGYRLARPAAEVSVADVIRAVDGPLANVAGARPEDVHYEGAAAPLRETWVALRAAIRGVLENVTLADLASGAMPEQVTGLLLSDDVWHARR